MSSSGSSSVGSILYASSERTRSIGLEASISRSSSSRIPSPIDAQSVSDLEIMKSCHDVVSVVTDESLGSIRECCSIPEEYALQAPLPEQRPYTPESFELRMPKMSGGSLVTIARVPSSPLEVEEVHVSAPPKRSVGASASKQTGATRPAKRVKISDQKHKSCHGEGSSRKGAG
ncbi:hypothetical protein BHE74_00042320 [Ensete ventricosum]|nr:hypothetical protein BHE74_00042320 [Ensete ventricosum]